MGSAEEGGGSRRDWTMKENLGGGLAHPWRDVMCRMGIVATVGIFPRHMCCAQSGSGSAHLGPGWWFRFYGEGAPPGMDGMGDV